MPKDTLTNILAQLDRGNELRQKSDAMKKIILTSLLASIAFILAAQEQTLFKNGSVMGGFGSPIIEISSIAGETGAMVGGGGAVVIGSFFLGGYGIGTNYPEVKFDLLNYNVKYGHGGLWMGAAPGQWRLFHPYASLRLGWGKAQMRNDVLTFSDRHFTLTPELGGEVNIAPFLKIAFTATYRWTSGIQNLPGLTNDDFSGFGGILTFRIGGFGNYDEWDW